MPRGESDNSKHASDKGKGKELMDSTSRLNSKDDSWRGEEVRQSKRHKGGTEEYDCLQSEGDRRGGRHDSQRPPSRANPRSREIREGEDFFEEKKRENEDKGDRVMGLGSAQDVGPFLRADKSKGLGSAQDEVGLAKVSLPSSYASSLKVNPGSISGMNKTMISESNLNLKDPSEALGSFVKTDNPLSLECFQEVIAKAMKEAMANQLSDWFSKGKSISLTAGDIKHDQEEGQGKIDEKKSASQASFVPATNYEDPGLQAAEDKIEQIGEIDSFTRDFLIEAGEQFSRERQASRERKQKEKEENE